MTHASVPSVPALRGVVHVLHIGKTGGTAVKFALTSAGETNVDIRLHDHHVTLRDVPYGEQVVFFVRDPVSRFVSGFYSRQRQGRPRYHVPWSNDESDAFETFDTANALATALTDSNRTRRHRAESAMRSIMHVRDSYWKWFDSEAYFSSRLDDILCVGFQEHLERDFALLVRLLDLPPTAALPTDDVRAHRNPPTIDTRLTPEAVQNLARWYAPDLAFVEICRKIAATWWGPRAPVGPFSG